MKDGFIKVGASSPKIKVGDTGYNIARQIECARAACGGGVKVLVFPELCVTAYTCSDLFFQQSLLKHAEESLAEYIRETAELDMISFLGVPVPVAGRIYNCAAAISRGRLLGLVPKTNIPNYNEFYEARQFAPAPSGNRAVRYAGQDTVFGTRLLFVCSDMPELTIAAEICEDVWVPVPPSCAHAAAGATVIVNLSASDELVGKPEYRQSLIAMHSARLICGYVFADAGEGESGTDMVFSANDLICENGVTLARQKAFADKTYISSELDLDRLLVLREKMNTYPPLCDDGYEQIYFDLAPSETPLSRHISRRPFVPSDRAGRDERCELIVTIQSRGLAGRLESANAAHAVIGVSGGLDSTLALLVAVRAFDRLALSRSGIIAVTMPGFGTTSRTKSNAEILCEALGVTLRTIPIGAAVKQHFADIGHDGVTLDVVYENSQARERTQILMDVANSVGGLVVGTGDLSELALGWATYNGDHMSMYGVNASVPKTLVRHIVKWCADEAASERDATLASVLEDILATPVSPELLPPKDGEISQKTEGIVGPYELHDFFLYYLMRFGFPPAKIYRLARYAFAGEYDDATILQWLKIFIRRFFSQQFKRSCLPDGPKVGSVALSPRGDLRMPSDACARQWLEELEEL